MSLNVFSLSTWGDHAVSSCREDMARGFNEYLRALERRIQEFERKIRRKSRYLYVSVIFTSKRFRQDLCFRRPFGEPS